MKTRGKKNGEDAPYIRIVLRAQIAVVVRSRIKSLCRKINFATVLRPSSDHPW